MFGLFGKKDEGEVGVENPHTRNRSMPAKGAVASTTDTVPIVGVLENMLVTEDGRYIMMLEFPELDMGMADQGFVGWMSRYKYAMDNLKPGLHYQISVLQSPYNPEKDLRHFYENSQQWQLKKYGTEEGSRESRMYEALELSGDRMASYLAMHFSRVHPVTWRMVMVFSVPLPMQNKGGVMGFGAKKEISMDRIIEYSEKAYEKLGDDVTYVMQAFSQHNIHLNPLTHGQMCQVIWQAMHPAASGERDDSMGLLVDQIVNGEEIENPMPAAELFYPGMPGLELAQNVAPDTLSEEPEYLIIGDTYWTGLVVHNFTPHRAAIMHQLSSLSGGWTGALHVEIADPAIVSNQLRQREVQVKSSEYIRSMKGMIPDHGTRQEITAIDQQRAALEMANQLPMFIRFFVAVTATSLDELFHRKRELTNFLDTIGAAHYLPKFQLYALWQSIIPAGKTALSQNPRNMTPASLSTFFWPRKTRLGGGKGMYFGISDEDGRPVYLDLFGERLERNPTFLILGQPGAGKTITLKAAVVSALQAGDFVIAVDIEGQMRQVCEHYGGRYIEVGASDGERLNVLDIPPNSKDELAAGVEHVIGFIETVAQKPISKGQEWNALENAYLTALEDRGWVAREKDIGGFERFTPIPGAWDHSSAPVLSDLYAILASSTTSEAAGSLAAVIAPYAKGIYAPHFNNTTTFDVTNERLVVFGMQNLDAASGKANTEVYLWQVFSIIWGEVLRRYEQQLGASHVMFDEVWAFLKNGTGAGHISNMARRFRKRKAALWLATQQIDEFFTQASHSSGDDAGKSVGEIILGLTANQFLMGQRQFQAQQIQKALKLPDDIVHHLVSAPTGRGVLLTPHGNTRVNMAVPAEWGIFPREG